MSALEVFQVPVLSDNYVYLAHDRSSGQTAVVDPAVVGPVMDAARARNWRISHIINTHHHNDHTGGNLEIKEETGCTIVGPRNDRDRIPGIDIEVGENDVFALGASESIIFDVPGHTSGHIAYWFRDSDTLFCGDTLFAMGCGRMFEGTADQMWTSLSKLRRLPGSTRIYCAHEYTQANGRFALSVDPENSALVARMDRVNDLRERNLPTVPSTMDEELETNPFLRVDQHSLMQTIGMVGRDPVSVFAETRRLKDNF